MRIEYIDPFIVMARAGVDFVAEAQKSARAAEQAASDAERWGRLALKATDHRSAEMFASVSSSAALRCGLYATEARELAPDSAAAQEAMVVVSSAELHARHARGAADLLVVKP